MRPCSIHPRLCQFGLAESIAAFPFRDGGANGGITMNDLNRVQLIGHLGQDPETKYTATGTARTTFSVATSARWKDADGQVQEATEGSRVYLAGRLHTLRWEDAQTGERHARVEIVLDDLILLDRRGGTSVAATDDADALPFLSGGGRGRPGGSHTR